MTSDQSQNKQPLVVLTPLGKTIIEIQGDLELPTHIPPEEGQSEEDVSLRFGLLDIQENDDDPTLSRVTLYVGKKQRLLGKVVSLDVPLGLLQFEKTQNKVILRDVIRYKIIFQDRPLPIM